MKAPAHMNFIFLSGDMNALRPELGDRRFMFVKQPPAGPTKEASSFNQNFSAWSKAVLSSWDTAPLAMWKARNGIKVNA